MSPLPLRRYRAERLLRQEFERRREEVLKVVRARLRSGGGPQLDRADLEACYAMAWQALYAALLEGREIANPLGWLTVVTHRRALDEQRAIARGAAPAPEVERPGRETVARARDLAAELDDRAQLRQLFEGLRGRLNARECEAASLCYLQGLSRAQAAAQMGIGEATMRKLMEGRGPGRPGVASKVAELLRAIGGGEWCEQQASLMRGLAFGLLDPEGERYRLACVHQRECPSCRAYVLSLRGLAAVLPPLVLPWGMGAGVGAGAGAGVGSGAGAGAGVGSGAGAGAGVGSGAGAGAGAGVGSGAGAGTGAGVGSGAGSAVGAGTGLGAGVGGTKLVVGCLLALGVGCVAVVGLPRQHHVARSTHGQHVTPGPSGTAGLAESAGAHSHTTGSAGGGATAGSRKVTQRRAGRPGVTATRPGAQGERAQREFGLERRAAPTGAPVAGGRVGGSAPAGANAASTQAGGSTRTAPTRSAGRAEREFGP